MKSRIGRTFLKFISVVLAATMLMGPMSNVFAADGGISTMAAGTEVGNYTTLNNALQKSGTVTISNDFTFGSSGAITIPAGVSVTIEGNGHTITAGNTHSAFNVKGTLTLKNVTIKGKGTISEGSNVSTTPSNSGAGVIVHGTGKLTLGYGATVTGFINSGRYGGGIYAASGSTVTLENGSKVTGNEVTKKTAGSDSKGRKNDNADADELDARGGGIYSAGTLIIKDGAEVSRNWSAGAGGGIFIAYSGYMDMTGGEISWNWAGMGQGNQKIPVDKNNDGILQASEVAAPVSDNSTGSEGGGIYIQSKNTASKITAGVIENNGTHTIFDFGGGGIFIQASGKLEVNDALITNNTAYNYGGGVAGCTNGVIHIINVDSGAAIYDNTAIGTGAAYYSLQQTYGSSNTLAAGTHWIPVNIVEQPYLNQSSSSYKYQTTGSTIRSYYDTCKSKGGGKWDDYYCSRDSIINATMLGGGTANWKGVWSEDKSGDAKWTGFIVKNLKYETKGLTSGFISSRGLTGLTANPDAAAKKAAEEAVGGGKQGVIIRNNFSNTNGGGITCNGWLTFGNTSWENEQKIFTPATLTLNGNKVLQATWSDGTKLGVTPDTYEFTLTGNGITKTVKNAADGKFSFTFSSDELKSLAGFTDAQINSLTKEKSLSETKTFTVVEKAGNDKGVTYSTQTYKVNVTITLTFVEQTTAGGVAGSKQITVKKYAYGATYKVDGKETLEFVNDVKSGKLAIQKIINKGDHSLDYNKNQTFTFDVTFTYTDASGKVYTNTEVITVGADGKAVQSQYSYPVGTKYSITERDPHDDRWTIPKDAATGTITADDVATAKTVSITNTYNEPYGSFTLKKELATAEHSAPMGAEQLNRTFTFHVVVKNKSGVVIDEFDWNLKNGETKTSDNYPAGSTYTITETGKDELAEEGFYSTTGEVTDGKIQANVVNNHTVTNSYWRAKDVDVDVNKTWNEGGVLKPEEITVQLYRDGKPVDGKTATLSDAAGWSYTWENLPERASRDSEPYKYEVKEVSIKYNNGYTAEHKEGSDLFVVYDPARPGTEDTDTYYLIGGWRTKTESSVTTDTEGDKVSYTYNIENKGFPAKDIGSASFGIEKLDDDGRPLAGAKFTLTFPDGRESNVTTDANGKARFDGLVLGDYTLTETEAPKGHDMPETNTWKIKVEQDKFLGSKIEVEGPTLENNWSWKASADGNPLTPNGDLIGVLQVTNNIKKYTLTLEKKVSFGSFSASVEGLVFKFQITSADGSYDKTVEVKANETVTLTDLKYDTYTIKELPAPEVEHFDWSSVTITANVGKQNADGSFTITADELDAMEKGARTVTVTATNNYEIDRVNLDLKKDVLLTGGDGRTGSPSSDRSGVAGKSFTFTITGTAVDGSKVTFDGKEYAEVKIVVDKNGFGRLDDASKKLLSSLPAGVYTVTEAETDLDNFTFKSFTLTTSDNVTISDDGKLSFTVDLTNADDNATITLSAQNTYEIKKARFSVEKQVVLDGNDYGMVPTNNQFTFWVRGTDFANAEFGMQKTVTAGDTITFRNVPFGTYTIGEFTTNVPGYDFSGLTLTGNGLKQKTDAAGNPIAEWEFTIDESNTELVGDVYVTNISIIAVNHYDRKSADLSVRKDVVGNHADFSSTWDFTVALRSPADYVVLRNSYDYIVTNEDGTVAKVGKIERIYKTGADGVRVPETVVVDGETYFVYGTISGVGNGQTATVEKLPVGTSYHVTEVRENSDGYITTYTDRDGVIDEDGNIVGVENDRSVYTSVPVRKVWRKSEGAVLPESVTVELLQNGTVIKSHDLVEDDDWYYEFTGLDYYDKNDKPYEYTVKEVVPEEWEGKWKQAGVTLEDGVFVITNTELTGVYVKKTWIAPDDVVRPELIITLYADGEPVRTGHLPTDDGKWELYFENLDKVDPSGRVIQYTVEETPVNEGDLDNWSQTCEGDADRGFEFTNTLKTSIDVDKIWYTPDGVIKPDIVVKLFRGKVDTGMTLTLSSDNNWTGTFENLDVCGTDGVRYEYTVVEEPIKEGGWYSTVNKNEDGSFTVTNIKTTDIPVEKIWNVPEGTVFDNEVVVINLYRSDKPDEVYQSLTLDADDVLENGNWGGTFYDLPLYDEDGNELTYTVKEVKVDGYSVAIDNDYRINDEGVAVTGFKVTNTRLTDVEVVKEWIIPEGLTYAHPTEVEVQLKVNGENYGDPVTLNEENGWTYKWTGIDANAEITLVEKTPVGWKDSCDGEMTENNGLYTIKLNNTLEVTSIDVTKDWIVPEGYELPESVTVILYADDEEYARIEIKPDDEGKWHGSFNDLPVYSEAGSKIEYRVEEVLPGDEWRSEQGGSVEEGVTLVNTLLRDFSVEKVWLIPEGEEVPESVTIILLADGVEVDRTVITPDEEGKWNGKFTDKPVCAEDGHEIKYEVVEELPDGEWRSIVTPGEGGFTVTNTELTEITVKKVWTASEGVTILVIPEGVTVRLMADGEQYGEAVVLNEENGWTYTWTGLDKRVNYTIVEDEIVGWDGTVGEPVQDEDGLGVTITLTNERTTPQTGSLTVKKTVTGNDGDKTKEFTFTVTLSDKTINGVYGGMTFTDGVATFHLRDGESRTATGLPAGITYTVTEAEANTAGYDTSVEGDEGTIPSDDEAVVEFENHKDRPTPKPDEGSLTVRKTVSGNATTTQTRFAFTVTLSDRTINGWYGEMYFVNGVAEFTLRHNESITATGLPAGISYKVEEEDLRDEGYDTSAEGDEGTIPGGDVVVVEFENHRHVEVPGPESGPLAVRKLVTGEEGELDREFHFTVTLSDKTINGKYGDMVFVNGVAEFTLKSGEVKWGRGIPVGTEYVVAEAEANTEGYDTIIEGEVGGIIRDVRSEVRFHNHRGPWTPDDDLPWEEIPDDEIPLADIPQTGDSFNGLAWSILLFGSALCTAILMGEIFIEKKKKRD